MSPIALAFLFPQLVQDDPVAGGAFVLPEGPTIACSAFTCFCSSLGRRMIDLTLKTDRSIASDTGLNGLSLVSSLQFDGAFYVLG